MSHAEWRFCSSKINQQLTSLRNLTRQEEGTFDWEGNHDDDIPA